MVERNPLASNRYRRALGFDWYEYIAFIRDVTRKGFLFDFAWGE